MIKLAALACLFAGGLGAQQFKIDLDYLESKAENTVDVSLNKAMLQLGAKFLDANDPDEAKAKKLVSGLEGIYVRSYEFKNRGAYSQADLDKLRNQLKGPEWSRIVGVKSAADGDTAEVYVRMQNEKITGVAVLAANPKELTVVNIVGPVDLDSLADLSGHFGVPKLLGKPPHK